MTPQKKTEWSPEPFPEPRTFPSGWDGTASDQHQRTA